MARPRETDKRKHPEQSQRVKDAMKWAGIESAAQLHEKVSWEWSPRTTTSRVEGDTKLTALERKALATVLNVEPEMLEAGGPPVPSPNSLDWVEGYIVTGSPGTEQVTVVKSGHIHEVITLKEARARGLVPASAEGERLGEVRPPSSRSAEESA